MAQHLPPDDPPASPTDCTLVRRHLDAFVDGELASINGDAPAMGHGIAGHLASCTRCARAVHQLRTLRDAVRAVGARERETVRASEALRRRAAMILSSSR